MQKQEKIVKMFDDIAPTYDKANRILSFGTDVNWRKKACLNAFKYVGNQLDIVDVACGTGDMIIEWQNQANKMNKEIVSIKGIDPSIGMLEVAKKKRLHAEFIQAKAQELPLKSQSADIISISYGIRNVIDRKEAIKEFSRVLKKDGILLVLEFTKREQGGFIANCRDFYLKNILPKVGGFISKNYTAYEYLPNSIENFLSKEDFIDELSEYFQMLEYKSFSYGICSEFIARKK
ncbi:bifunctional demethylmenaquinone methyltransferase/2-methoxy-6-polyprenyl-1,4-benzoquinol methylase UbiE [Campylobacter insulaenigrae]|uniref:bifunctional demethylmenaquinone methyltransferase/2-methoxy-6-polyprenyl-1,4-benzoquinol methylase UbiE n=1 Tax=Campylobacter insulaenigrae TaxID=260714 RepID=UPI002153335B|nr:bifunctional demethylmenaquinone methyltransferase/2-methoxy-6-polyprenyl-1,4-benzoquinol methylase UbiE [Campylobacter insulaenigrae]MCR6571238.1 bifunctional demethylmenaquinone methyltransferase/2-methoxy-6-polyprenyl-1,4-benzoquinol methylase UbiE [Campylobacter insulaenigrae]MCR6573020.1 bifunctional demethylmenaquinone methyltransferase/2-methoxy-6-polyprenyl-1,4-benzoquinol methylase UbiE [Campylobacter insulaenigrae]MCR6574362.1 bifunctional demethylmenaquinone methyltransferase/2-met